MSIEIKSLPLDKLGQPILNQVGTQHTNIKEITQGGIELRTEFAPVYDEKVINLESKNSKLPRIFKYYPGSVLELRVMDRPGSIAPSLLCLGDVQLVKGHTYKLTFEDAPIKGFTKPDPSPSAKHFDKIKLYPEELTTQAELFETILSHSSIVECPWVSMALTHRPEIQEKLDIEELQRKEAEFIKMKEERLKKFQEEQEELEKERERLFAKKTV